MTPWWTPEHAQQWLAAFALTQAFEVPVYALALSGAHRSRAEVFMVAFGASALTHPVVWFVMPWLVGEPLWLSIALSEVFAVGVEAAWLAAWKLRAPLRTALIANATSFLVGGAIMTLLYTAFF